jgi:tellurite resistance protein
VRIEDYLLGSLIRGALGARGKPHLRAARFLTGGASRFGIGLNLPTMIGAAGLAWGAYEHMKDRNPSVLTTIEGGGFAPAGSPPPPMPPPLPRGAAGGSASRSDLTSSDSTTSLRPPPLPIPNSPGSNATPVPRTSASQSTDSRSPAPPSTDSHVATTPGPDALRRLVALTIAAARADGELGEEEYGQILASAREHGAEKLVSEELANRRTIQEIVVGAMDPTFREHLYALAYGIVRADASISAVERKWMRELALALDLDSQAAARIEQETANKIDRQIG